VCVCVCVCLPQTEQQARLDAQLELNRAKKRQSIMETELQQEK